MTTTINASTSSGLVNTADTSGILQLQTANTAAVTIDASQRAGVGTTTLDNRLNVKSIGNAYNNGAISIESASAVKQYITTISDTMYFGNSTSVDMMALNANGIALGPSVVAASSGVGIKFPATQSASSNANTLDDYEEGTWTPSVGGTASMASSGTYVKIGKMVTVNFDLIINSLGTGSTTSITNFPFNSSNDGFPRTGCVSYYSGLTISPIFIAPYLGNNSTAAVFVWNTAGGSSIGFNASNLFQTSSRIIGSLTYSADA
jgi:hypothetical protein